MKNLLLFNLDNTLSLNEKPIANKIVKELKRLSKNNDICIVSLRPMQYLLGIAKQSNISNVSLIAEEGGDIITDIGNSDFLSYTYQPRILKTIYKIKKEILSRYSNDIHVQATLTNFSFTINNNIELKNIENYINKLIINSFEDEQFDLEFIINEKEKLLSLKPKLINKASGILAYMELNNAEYKNIIAFGNSSIDDSMFEMSNKNYVIGSYKYKKAKNIDQSDILNIMQNIK